MNKIATAGLSIIPSGTRVLITMAARFGDVGIRPHRLTQLEHGYMTDLCNWRRWARREARLVAWAWFAGYRITRLPDATILTPFDHPPTGNAT